MSTMIESYTLESLAKLLAVRPELRVGQAFVQAALFLDGNLEAAVTLNQSGDDRIADALNSLINQQDLFEEEEASARSKFLESLSALRSNDLASEMTLGKLVVTLAEIAHTPLYAIEDDRLLRVINECISNHSLVPSDRRLRKDGVLTADLAVGLAFLLVPSGYRVICSHRGWWDSNDDEVVDSGVEFREVGIYFERHARSSRLAIVDLAIIKDGITKLLIEVEESAKGESPKKLISDLCLPSFGDFIGIYDKDNRRREQVTFDEAMLWLVHQPRKGDDRERTRRFEDRFNLLLKAGKSADILNSPASVRILTVEPSNMVSTIIEEVTKQLGIDSTENSF